MSLEDAYTRIFERAYDVSMVADPETSEPSMRKIIKDADLDILYEALKRSAVALEVAREMFTEYAGYHRAKLDGLLTLVERIDVEKKAVRNEVLAQMMRGVLLGRHQGAVGEKVWFPIDAAPQHGDLRLLGRRIDGGTYIETGRWELTKWSVESREGFKAPTHYALLETLPTEYQR